MKYLVVIWGSQPTVSFIPYTEKVQATIIKDNQAAYEYAVDAYLQLTGEALEDFRNGVEDMDSLKTGQLVTLYPELISLIQAFSSYEKV